MQGFNAILVPGGFGERGTEGKIKAAKFARENHVPYLGICLGMQMAVIELQEMSLVTKMPDLKSLITKLARKDLNLLFIILKNGYKAIKLLSDQWAMTRAAQCD